MAEYLQWAHTIPGHVGPETEDFQDDTVHSQISVACLTKLL